MKAVVLGSTGLLGQAMVRELSARGHQPIGVARRAAAVSADISNDKELVEALDRERPDLVVNCAALVDIEACERDPGTAWKINARPLSFLAQWAVRHDCPLLHVSTDHYYTEGGSLGHRETDPVVLLNEYARTKYAAEAFALTAPQALTLRTSIVGLRGWPVKTFAEWAIEAVEEDRAISLFADSYTSSIDVETFAAKALDLAQLGCRGIYNLGSREVVSKEAFIREIAAQLGCPLSKATVGSVGQLATRRATSLGLDVRRAEEKLGSPLPTLAEVVRSILSRRTGAHDG